MFLWVYDMCLRKSLARRTEVQDPALNMDTVLTEVNNAIWLEAENGMPLYQSAFNAAGGNYAYPPVPVIPGAGSELQAQNNAFMAEAKAAMEVMRHAAERGAEQGVGQTQLMQKFSATGTAAVGAVQNGEVRSVERSGAVVLKKNLKKGKVQEQKPAGTARKFFGPDGGKLKGKFREAAYQAAIAEAKENGTFGKNAQKAGGHH
jgi:hypothetical protein